MYYVSRWKLLPDLQSPCCCASHFTETMVLRVLSDILVRWTAAISLLDLPAAVDHSTLLRRLVTTYGICCTVLGWFESYLHSR